MTGDGGAQDATTQPPIRPGSTLSIADLLRGAVRDSDGRPFEPDEAKYSYLGERALKTPKHALAAAVLGESKTDRERRPEIRGVHTLYAPLRIGQDFYRAKLIVRDTNMGINITGTAWRA